MVAIKIETTELTAVQLRAAAARMLVIASSRRSRSRRSTSPTTPAFEETARNLPRFIEEVCNAKRLHSSLGYLSPIQFGQSTRDRLKTAA